MSLTGKVAIVTGGQQRHRQGDRAGARGPARQHRHRLRRAIRTRPMRWSSRSSASAARRSAWRPTSARSTTCRSSIDATVKEFGRLDIMVNNAGVETRTSILDTTEDQYERVLEINLKSAFFGTQLAAKQMIAQGDGGRIINVTSVHEDWPMPGNTAYCVSKGGMRMLTRTAGVELGPHGVLVVGVGPGAVETPINTVDDERPGAAEDPRRRDPDRAHGEAGGDRQRRRVPRGRRRELPRPRPRCSPTAASCTRAPASSSSGCR